MNIAPAEPVLIVGPGDGFQHFVSEGQKLGLELTHLTGPDDFQELHSKFKTQNSKFDIPPGFYYTSYTQLSRVGTKHGPSLATLAATSFAAVAVDEAVRLKDAGTLLAQGVFKLQPRFRLAATATPQKHRLRDLFWLAWWVAGARPERHALFPFDGSETGQRQFIEKFQVTEFNLTREAEYKMKHGRTRRFKKPGTQPTNLAGIYRVLAPLLIRRRKEETNMPPKTMHVLRVPLGTTQHAAYQAHLEHNYVTSDGQPCIIAKLTALRRVAANPASPVLDRSVFRSAHNYTPKVAAALGLCEKRLRAGQPGVLFSAHTDLLDVMSHYLGDAGVPHFILDGRVSPERRGELCARFKAGEVPIALCGAESVAELHSFAHCPWGATLSYGWARDKALQAVNRIHRRDSVGPVDFYSVLGNGSVDFYIAQLIRELNQASAMVVDGALEEEPPPRELSPVELLAQAREVFAKAGPTLDEEEILEHWPDLRRSLGEAVMKGFPSIPRGTRSVVPDSAFRIPHSALAAAPTRFNPLAFAAEEREASLRPAPAAEPKPEPEPTPAPRNIIPLPLPERRSPTRQHPLPKPTAPATFLAW